MHQSFICFKMIEGVLISVKHLHWRNSKFLGEQASHDHRRKSEISFWIKASTMEEAFSFIVSIMAFNWFYIRSSCLVVVVPTSAPLSLENGGTLGPWWSACFSRLPCCLSSCSGRVSSGCSSSVGGCAHLVLRAFKSNPGFVAWLAVDLD